MNDDRIKQLEDRIARLEDALVGMNHSVADFARYMGQEVGKLQRQLNDMTGDGK